MAPLYSVTGRCTRAHALDQEADILQKLAEKNVKHVPKFLCGEDLDGETTVTDLYALEVENSPTDKIVPRCAAPWVVDNDRSRITRRIHHQFVVDSIGKPLSTIENSKQLMQVVSDTYTGNLQAYEECGVIHRDISGRNILIDKNGHGVLYDWDLAKHKDKSTQERTGTWKFISYLLLIKHHSIHTIQDNMESFVYVMLYFGLRYLQHNSDTGVPVLLTEIFDHERINKKGFVLGGKMKRYLLRDPREYLGVNFKFLSTPFQRWFEWAAQAAYEWIQHCDPRSQVAVEKTQGVEPQLQFFDHSKMAQAFIECLNSQDWPTDEPPPVDAAPKSNGGRRRTSKRSFEESEDIDEDGSIGGSRKQSRTSHVEDTSNY